MKIIALLVTAIMLNNSTCFSSEHEDNFDIEIISEASASEVYTDQTEDDWLSNDEIESVVEQSENQDDPLVEQEEKCLYVLESSAEGDIDTDDEPERDLRQDIIPEKSYLRKILYKLCCCCNRR